MVKEGAMINDDNDCTIFSFLHFFCLHFNIGDICERETNRRNEEKEEIERSSRTAYNLKKGH